MKQVNAEIYQIVYVSTSKIKLEGKEIGKILEKARSKNNQAGVTGLLMVRGNMFVQLLEGDRRKVHETLKRIMADKRHSGIKIILEGTGSGRIFDAWSMGYIDEFTAVDSTSGVLDAIERLALKPGELRKTILKILRTCSSVLHEHKAS